MSARLGVGILLTGLSGAGKTTLAECLARRWEARTLRPMSVLDGDEARKLLSSELGFSREHRDLNINRLGYVAAEVMRHGGACVIASIAPYESSREQAKARMSARGLALIAHVSTSLNVCEARDPKGLYAKARAGLIQSFTGLDDPYEEPVAPDLSLDLAALSAEQACERLEAFVDARLDVGVSALDRPALFHRRG